MIRGGLLAESNAEKTRRGRAARLVAPRGGERLEDASMRLLRAMADQRRKGLSQGDAAAEEAAREAGIAPGSSEYRAALEYLLTSGDVEPHPNETLAAQGIYRINPVGRARLRGGERHEA